jgi:predicted CXXCH cytochrome family protein
MMRNLLAALLLLLSLHAFADLTSSKHNLSASGTGTVKAASETQICIFCHAPHNASPIAPLWNRSNPGTTYTPYASSTSVGKPGQPTGASLLCLSCHDGTTALGNVLSRSTQIGMAGGMTTMPAGNTNLGTDLSDDHPISFAYTATLAAARGNELVNPATLTGKVKLDAAGQLQCTSCHDPHVDANGKFLVMSNQGSSLCQTCHTKNYWNSSDHNLSAKTWNGVGSNPWPHSSGTTVAANACENCHRPHSAGGKKWLLNAAAEENNCYVCHNGNVAATNIQSELTTKSSIHPVAATTGVHDVAESAVISSRHVECADCHNPHATNSSTGLLPGSLTGMRGVDINGSEIKPATAEYQICFRCHADSTGQPAARTTRQIVQTNTRLEFATTSPSFHPVAGIGKNTNVPSLISPWTTSSLVKCSDCHNNNTGPGAGGTGPKGPHGSIYATLLERQYLKANNTTESAANYALCYKCHNRTSILSDNTFKQHKKHIVDLRTPCNACHDPHGISVTQGNATNNSKLINFDTTINKPSSSGQLKFVSTGTNKGSCYLNCHGENHNPYSY